MLKWIVLACFITVVAVALLIRTSGYDADTWHRMPTPKLPGDYDDQGSFQAVRAFTTTESGLLEAVDRIALQTPRTRRVSGAPETGMMTYETRSRVFGFPDYTTVALISPERSDMRALSIYARLRFGQADLGVNRARVTDWLERLGPLVVPPS